MSWYNLPHTQTFKPLFEFQILPAQNYPAGTSELIPLAPTQIYVEIVQNLEIFSLARNYPAVFRNYFLSAPSRIYAEVLHYVEISPLASNFGST